jgi:hypothetical protein
MILKAQLERAERIAEQARAQADRIEAQVKRKREEYKKDLEAEYNRALGIEKKVTIQQIAEEAIRTGNYIGGRRKAEALIRADYREQAAKQRKEDAKAQKEEEEFRRGVVYRLKDDYGRAIDDINRKYDDLIEDAGMFGTVGQFWARKNQTDELRNAELKAAALKKQKADQDAVNSELEDFFGKVDEADKMHNERLREAARLWEKQIDLARRYAGLVTGRGQGAWSARLGSMEAAGMVPGVPGSTTARQSGAMNFDASEMTRLLGIIARAAEKELRL